jgi:hypothetical protein
MLFIPPCTQAMRAVKLVMASRFPLIPSSHLTEALAAAVGFRSNAALHAAMWEPGVDPAALRALEFDDQRFTGRMTELGHVMPDWLGFDSLARSSWVSSTYTSQRRLVARNLMVAAVASGLAQRLFTLEENDNLWDGEIAQGRKKGTLFHVWMPKDIPALGWVSDIGHGELSIHVACWPRGDSIRAGGAGFHAGDAVATGWLERQRGKWIMDDNRGGISLHVRSHLQSVIANAIVPSAGFADQGKFIF